MVSTTDMSNVSYQAALQVAQQAIAALVKWTDAGEHLPSPNQSVPEEVISKAETVFEWSKEMPIGTLRLLFDFVKLPGETGQTEEHWYPLETIANTHPPIPYPLLRKPDSNELNNLKAQIKHEVVPVLQNEDNWKNLALLSLILEKYGSCLSFGKDNVALVDLARITGAVAAALAQNPEAVHLSLVAGDLSGIQNFIYTISSEGALKSLRARSFYLELVTQEIVERLLKKLKLPRTNIIYAGGGNLYLIAAEGDNSAQAAVDSIRNEINDWMLGRFQGKLFLALSSVSFPVEALQTQIATKQKGKIFSDYWADVIQNLAQQKLNRFNTPAQMSRVLSRRRSHDPCKVCHRDNAQNLKPLNEPDSPEACSTCREMFRLGEKLFKVEAVVRKCKQKLQPMVVDGAFTIATIPGYYYYLFEDKNQALSTISNPDAVFLINNWNIKDYSSDQHSPLLLGNYGQKSEQREELHQSISNFMRAGEFAQKAAAAGCIPRVGYLRMDVDRLGQIFAKGLDKCYSLPRLAGLSRQMSYFFKVYLNTLAQTRQLPNSARKLTDSDRPNLLFIYAGGDDLFVSGAWNEVVEFAFDVYQSFRTYTGYHPDITLSGGISIDDIKFPLYQSAESSGEAERQAKGNGRDSLGLFGTAFKWNQWLGATEAQSVQTLTDQFGGKAENHLNPKDKPEWLGILPFVRSLYKELKGNYSRNFVRNLLITAELQEQAIKEKQEQIDKIRKNQSVIQENPDIVKLEREREEIRYYLHLPKVAYTLARLPEHLRKEDSFKPIRTSLKSPYNAPYFRAIATWIELLHRN